MNLTKEQALQQIENLKKFVEGLDKPKLPELFDGHLYQARQSAYRSENIYVYSKNIHTLVSVRTGECWNPERGYGTDTDNNCDWKDVTNDYKLVKI